MKPTVTTADSTGSTLRLTMVCSASTISAPMTKGSVPRCGWAAWLPRPAMRMSQLSAAAQCLLGGREDEVHGAFEIAGLRQVLRGAQQHGGVAVMAAGMHLAVVGGAVGERVALLDRQRIHVR